jgi:hypothetical protein
MSETRNSFSHSPEDNSVKQFNDLIIRVCQVIVQSRYDEKDEYVKRNMMYNMELEVSLALKQNLAEILKKNMPSQLYLDIYVGADKNKFASLLPLVENVNGDTASILLERWSIHLDTFSSNLSTKKPTLKIYSLIRKLFTMARLLPAFDLSKVLKSMSSSQNADFSIKYSIYDNLNGALVFSDASISNFEFSPLSFPDGKFQMSVTYQKNCDSLVKCIRSIKPVDIIPNYYEQKQQFRTPTRSDSKRSSLVNQQLQVNLGIDPILPQVRSIPIPIRASSDSIQKDRRGSDEFYRRNSDEKVLSYGMPNGMSSSPNDALDSLLYGKTPPLFNGNPVSLQKTPPQFSALNNPDNVRIFKINNPSEMSAGSSFRSGSRSSSFSDENAFFTRSDTFGSSSDIVLGSLLISLRNAPMLKSFQDASGNSKQSSVSNMLSEFDSITLEIHDLHKRNQT